MKEENIKPPQPSRGDYLHTTTRALLSTIPVLGGPAVEMFNAILQSPIEKRRQVWVEDVTQALIKLQEEKAIKIEDLKNNELFISVLLEATLIALKTHNQQKKEILKTAIVHSALNIDLDDDLAVLFVRYLDELTTKQILLLHHLNLAGEKLLSINGYEEMYKMFFNKVGNSLSKDEFKFLCQDLNTKGLLRISEYFDDFTDIYNATIYVDGANNLPRIRVADLGKKFLEFVSL